MKEENRLYEIAEGEFWKSAEECLRRSRELGKRSEEVYRKIELYEALNDDGMDEMEVIGNVGENNGSEYNKLVMELDEIDRELVKLDGEYDRLCDEVERFYGKDRMRGI